MENIANVHLDYWYNTVFLWKGMYERVIMFVVDFLSKDIYIFEKKMPILFLKHHSFPKLQISLAYKK